MREGKRGMVEQIVKIVNNNKMVRGSHERGDLDGRRDASEERRPIVTSTSRRRILNREGCK